MGDSLQLSLEPKASELRRCSEAMRTFLGQHRVSERAVYHVDLALEEMVGNIMRYSRARSPISVGLTVRRDVIEINIQDDGVAFDPTQVPEPKIPRTAAEAAIGGLGIHMVRGSVAHMRYSRADSWNRLALHIWRSANHAT